MSGSCCVVRESFFFGSPLFIFLFLSLPPLQKSLRRQKKRRSENNMAYGRRYKAKLHVLEEDDLASILTPAAPCKVPGLGTKGRKGDEKEERFFFLFFAPRSLFFSAALVACESFRCRLRLLFVLCSPIERRHRYAQGQCPPLEVRVWVVKGSIAGYDAMRFLFVVVVFFLSSIDLGPPLN